MLDIKFIRENPELLKTIARQKNINVDIERIIKLDDQRKKLTTQIEEQRAKKNQASKEIPKLAPTEKAKALADMRAVDALQKEFETKLKPIQDEFDALMLNVPNFISDKTPVGLDDAANVEIERWGEVKKFDFVQKDHMQIGRDLDIVDNERAAKIGGTRSYLLKGDGARLEAALIKYAEDFIVRKGFTLMSVPVIVNKEALIGTGYLPGAEEEIYFLERDDKYLVGTSEVAIGEYYANEVLKEEDLPIRFAGFSVCFRREAGAYGKDTSGLYRVHQFIKVEQFIIGKNDIAESERAFDELLNNSKELLRSLKLPHRVLNVCTGDMGKGKYYMNDLETWMPSRQAFGETHSCSNLLDFQARRLNLRYKDKDGKIHFCHTLNNTVLATPRILIPVLENNQNANGSVTIPEVLWPYMDGQEIISTKFKTQNPK